MGPKKANGTQGRRGTDMETKIKARVQKSRRVFVHNDLAQATEYYADTVQDKLDRGTRDAIMFDGMACTVMAQKTSTM